MDKRKQEARARRKFTPEYKEGVVRLVLDENKTVGQVVRDLDLTASALGRWVEQARADERSYLQRLVERTQRNLSQAAQIAGLERHNLRELLKKHGLYASSK